MSVSNVEGTPSGPSLWEVESIVDVLWQLRERGVVHRREEQPTPNRDESWRASCKHSH